MMIFLIGVSLVIAEIQCQDLVASILHGGGTSLSAEWLHRWFQLFQQERQFRAFLDYSKTGSTIGKLWIKGELNDAKEYPPIAFAGSDTPLHEQDYTKHPSLQMFPLVASAVTIVYNVPGVSDMNLSLELLSKIYNGTITEWNHSDIKLMNPESELPQHKIRVIARRDGAGNTDVFTRGLSAANNWWNENIGYFSEPNLTFPEGPSQNWPGNSVEFFAEQSDGMSSMILSIPYSLGFLGLSAAVTAKNNIANLKNSYGTILTEFDIEQGVKAAMDHGAVRLDGRYTVNLVNEKVENAYPLATFTYMILNMTTHPDISCEQVKVMINFINFIFSHSSQSNITKGLLMVDIPPLVAEKVMKDVLNQIKCKNDFVIDLIILDAENDKNNSFPTIYYIMIAIGMCLAILVATYCYKRKNSYPVHADTKAWYIKGQDFTVMGGTSFSASYKFFSEGHSALLRGEKALAFQILDTNNVASKCMTEFKIETELRLYDLTFKVSHENVLRLWGLSDEGVKDKIWHVYESSSKGSVHQALSQTPFDLGENVKWSLSRDVTAGLAFLHKSDILHGLLDTWNCYLTANWTVKISNWLQNTQDVLEPWSAVMIPNRHKMVTEGASDEQYQRLTFRHIELLINRAGTLVTKEHDVHSLGMVFYEIYTTTLPYSDLISPTKTWRGIFDLITKTSDKLLPKHIYDSVQIDQLNFAMLKCKIDVDEVYEELKKCKPSSGESIVDVMMTSMEKYVTEIEDKTHELNQVSMQMENLLSSSLPREIALSLRVGDPVLPKHFEQASVYFSDIVSFPEICDKSTAFQVVNVVNSIYTLLDNIIERYDVCKLETIGDAYMVASGLPKANGVNHVEQIVDMAIAIKHAIMIFKLEHLSEHKVQIRIGINSGPVMTGVVGMKMPRYCLFGDTVRVVCRLVSCAHPNSILGSKRSVDLLNVHFPDKFRIEEREKGKGDMITYWIDKPIKYTNNYTQNSTN